jgi:hypothetical protein
MEVAPEVERGQADRPRVLRRRSTPTAVRSPAVKVGAESTFNFLDVLLIDLSEVMHRIKCAYILAREAETVF